MSAVREAIKAVLDGLLTYEAVSSMDTALLLDELTTAVERVPVGVTIRELDMADPENIVTVRGIDNLQYVRDVVGFAAEEGALNLTVDGGYLKIKPGDYGTWCAPIQTEVYGQ